VCVCVRASVRACVHACVRACVRVKGRASVPPAGSPTCPLHLQRTHAVRTVPLFHATTRCPHSPSAQLLHHRLAQEAPPTSSGGSSGGRDMGQAGFILDGFPRTRQQVSGRVCPRIDGAGACLLCLLERWRDRSGLAQRDEGDGDSEGHCACACAACPALYAGGRVGPSWIP